MKIKSLIVLLLALCALLCACVPETPVPDENGFYAVGDKIVFANELGEAFATFCITEVLVSDETAKISVDSEEGGNTKDYFVVKISYELELEESGTAVDQTNFNITDCNGNSAVFLRKTGISGGDMAAQTLVYGVESVGEHVDISFVYDASKGYSAAVRAYFEPETEQSVLDGTLNEDESLFDDPVIRILNIVSLSATLALLAIAVAVFAVVSKKRKMRSRAEADKIASLAAAAMPARYNHADPDFSARVTPLRLNTPKKRKKKGFLFGLLSVLTHLAFFAAAGGLICVFGLMEDPDAIAFAIIIFVISIFIAHGLCPFITIWGSMLGLIFGLISLLRRERAWISYIAIALNLAFYIITAIHILYII